MKNSMISVSVASINKKPISGEMAAKARSQGWTAKEQDGFFVLSMECEVPQWENVSEAIKAEGEEFCLQAIQEKTDKRVRNAKTSAINNLLEGKDTPEIKSLQGTLAAFNVDVEALKAKMTPEQRYDVAYWKELLVKAINRK
jgi:maltooligosyltrehalose synthase